MLRFYYVVVAGFFRMLYYVMRASHYYKHPEKYDEEFCYRHAQKMVTYLRKKAWTKTNVYGEENLPSEGGYIMFANHQGKYDALGVFSYHKKPCSVLIEMNNSYVFSTKQVIDLTHGVRIDQTRPRQQLAALRHLGEEVRDGRRFLVFPEGKWGDNKNTLQEFHDGCFYSAYIAKCPIVPLVLIDSYKSMNTSQLFKRVTTEMHYLPPIPYEEYASMKRPEICAHVKALIQAKIDEVLSARGELPERSEPVPAK